MPSLAAETEQVSQCQHHQGAGKAPGPTGQREHLLGTRETRSVTGPGQPTAISPRGPPGTEESREHRVGCCSLRVK